MSNVAITRLPRVVPPAPGRPELAGPDHPMRKVTRQVALERSGWDPERARKVGALFDGLAPEWHARETPERAAVLEDALARGEVGGRAARCLELGCGTGFGTRTLAGRFAHLVAVDLSRGMLAHAPPECAHYVRADAGQLPVRDGWADVAVLVNMLLFPKELDRALAQDGVLVWVNSLGERTPIHLSADDVATALPGVWRGVASEAGWGTWCALRRGRPEEEV
jgi:SAM-dependent methyltransferase